MPEDLELIKSLSFKFAFNLAAGNYETASKQLNSKLLNKFSPLFLREEFEDMISYAESPADYIEVMEVNDMQDFASKHDNDIGWAYVAICGDDFSEAVSMVYSRDKDELKISELEWGRP